MYSVVSRIIPLILFVCVFWVFLPSLSHDFVNWDDPEHVLENPRIRQLDFKHLYEIFSSTTVNTYIPLTILSFALEYHFFGDNPFIYHFTNIILHAFVTVSVCYLFLLMGAGPLAALVAALVFGVHPMHVESVTWITERKDVLYASFYVLSLIGYLRYLQTGRFQYFLLTLLLGLLSLLAKPMALSLPLILCVFDWWQGRSLSVRSAGEKVCLALIYLPVLWKTFAAQLRIPEANFIEGSAIWLYTLTFYIKKFFFPFFLTPIYPVPEPVSFRTFEYGLAAVFFAGLLWLIIKRRYNRWLVFAVSYYFLSVFFLLKNDMVVKCIVTDRFMYLPSLGFCLLTGLAVKKISRQTTPQGRYVLAACVVLLLAVLTVKNRNQQKIWASSLSLWNYVIEHNSRSAVAFNNRGALLGQRKEFKKALQDLNKAVALRPTYREAYNNRAIVYFRLGAWNRSLQDYNTAIRLSPDYIEAYHNRGVLLLKKEQFVPALEDLNRVLHMDAGYYKGYNSRGLIYDQQGRGALALNDFTQAIALNPQYAEAYYNRGNTLIKSSLFLEALQDFDRALSINPGFAQAYLNKSVAFFALDYYPLALDNALKARQHGYPVNQSYMDYLVSLAGGAGDSD